MVLPGSTSSQPSFISLRKWGPSIEIKNNGGAASDGFNFNEFTIFVNNQMIKEHMFLAVGQPIRLPGTLAKDSIVVIGKYWRGGCEIVVNADI